MVLTIENNKAKALPLVSLGWNRRVHPSRPVRSGILLLVCLTSLSACSSAQKDSAASRQIEETLAAKKETFRACYENHLPTASPKPQGRFWVAFVIGRDGKVQRAEIQESTLKQPRIEDCILGAVRGTQFPALETGETAEVSYPFRFGLE